MLLQNIMKLLQKYGMNFLNGLGTTLLLALISVAIGCVIGAIVAILRLGKSKILKAIATVYTEVVRDTPLLLQLYFFYFLLPDIMQRSSCPSSPASPSRSSLTPAHIWPRSSVPAFSPSTAVRRKPPALWVFPPARP